MGNHAGFPARTRMTHVTGTGKYEQLLERCRSLGAIPTAVAHPCEASALAGRHGGGGRRV